VEVEDDEMPKLEDCENNNDIYDTVKVGSSSSSSSEEDSDEEKPKEEIKVD
jgi:hypothetical protein